MIKNLFIIFAMLLPMSVMAAMPTVAPRVNIFSTSTDWEAVTGLRLNQYRIKFIADKDLVKNGMQMYYLDGFPCYGQADRTEYWIGPNGAHSDEDLMLACVYAPTEIKLAWRYASRDATQQTTTGLLTCPVTGERDLTLDMSDCVVGDDWKERR